MLKRTLFLLPIMMAGAMLFAESPGMGVKLENYELNGENIVIVTDLLRDGPAFLAGLRPGDWVTSVNGTNTAGMDQKEISGFLDAAAQFPLKMTVMRFGQTSEITVGTPSTNDNGTNGFLFNNPGASEVIEPVTYETGRSPYAAFSSLSFQLISNDTLAVAMTAFVSNTRPGDIRVDYYFSDRNNGPVFHNGSFAIYSKGPYTNILFQTNNNLRLNYSGGMVEMLESIDGLKEIPGDIGVFLLARNPAVNLIITNFLLSHVVTNNMKVGTNRTVSIPVLHQDPDLARKLYDKVYAKELDTCGDKNILSWKWNGKIIHAFADPAYRKLVDGLVRYGNGLSSRPGQTVNVCLKLKNSRRGGTIDVYLQRYLVRGGGIMDILPERIKFTLTDSRGNSSVKKAQLSGIRYRLRYGPRTESVLIEITPKIKMPVMVHEINCRTE